MQTFYGDKIRFCSLKAQIYKFVGPLALCESIGSEIEFA